MNSVFEGRLGIQQRVLPVYRAPFFDALAVACRDGMSLFAGEPRRDEAIITATGMEEARYVPARNVHLLRGSFYLCWQRGLRDWLESWTPDALIVEANPRYLSTPEAVAWMHRRGRPVVGWGLGASPIGGFLSGMRWTSRLRFLGRFDALIAYSARGADEYAALDFPRERIFVAPNASAPLPVNPLPVRPASFAERPVALYVGRLQARKRVDFLLRACAALPVALQPRLVIAGDGPERASLEALAKQVYPRTEFIGAKFGADLAPYFTAADLFVLPGTGGLAVQEAMSYGLPVIVAQGDGTQDDLVRPGNGWRVPPDDLGSLTATLRDALSDAARLRALGAESYRIVREEINLEKMVEVFVGVLNGLR
jgi:glycosyltransferase involved in cell wall biosynthesis